MTNGYPLLVVAVMLTLSGKMCGADCSNEEAKNEMETLLKADILFVKRQPGGGGCLVQFRHTPR
jgi:hypothetical protein